MGTAIANYAYMVAASGNRTNAVEQLFSSSLNSHPSTINRTYTYDSIYRLAGETINGTPSTGSASYNYDPVGNRLSRGITGLSLPAQTFTFDANDRLNTDTYDANGNTLLGSGFGQSMADEYDFENRLVTRHTSSATVAITYDGDGNRVSKTLTTSTNSVTTYYVVDDLNPSGYAQVLEEGVATNSQPSTLNCVYTYGHTLISQQLLSTINSQPSTRFYGYDGHNNVRYLTDANGNVTDTCDYDAFGNLIARTGTTVNNYLFTGEQYDGDLGLYLTDTNAAVTDTYDYDAFGTVIAQSGITANNYLYCGEQFDSDLGLYYNRARYLDVDSGRFWSKDKFEGDMEDSLSLHVYLYGQADSVNMFDPTGFAVTVAEVGEEQAVNLQRNSDGVVRSKRAQKFINTVCKGARALNKTAEAIPGVYLIVGLEGNYVGSSLSIATRLTTHIGPVDALLGAPGTVVKTFAVDLEVAGEFGLSEQGLLRMVEQRFLQDLVGLDGIRKGGNLNKIRARSLKKFNNFVKTFCPGRVIK